MWKYIVTYFVVIVTPIIKNSGDTEPTVIGFKIPKNTFYIELRADTTKITQHFGARDEAEQFIKHNGGYTLSYQGDKSVFLLNFKLDSVKISRKNKTPQ